MSRIILLFSLLLVTLGQNISAIESLQVEQLSVHEDCNEVHDHIGEETSSQRDRNCDDCNDCSDEKNGHCLCTHVHPYGFLCNRHSHPLEENFISTNRIEWYFFLEYHSPTLDPALKPPLFHLHS